MTNKSTQKDGINTNKIPWSNIPMLNGKLNIPAKFLHVDSGTGMSILKMKYPAGFTNPWHTHDCAHGMYVLDGVLETNKGKFGPGEFIWFSELERMYHGASEENDVTFLFFTNKTFNIKYE